MKKESTNILLTGGDSRDGSLSGRSDTIMIATINPDTNKLLLSSIPRDSYVFNSCTGYNDKVTHVSNGGINCLISTLESELTTSIDYYAKINFESIISVVDSVGGITIDVDQSFCAQDENDVADAYCFEQGTANLNGSQALAYSRERKSFSDGDKTRVFHQQQVVAGILTEVKTASFSEINTIIGSVGDYVATNMSTTQISNLAQLFQNTDNISYESQILETTGDYADIPQLGLYSTSVQIIDESSRQEVSSKISFVLNE